MPEKPLQFPIKDILRLEHEEGEWDDRSPKETLRRIEALRISYQFTEQAAFDQYDVEEARRIDTAASWLKDIDFP